eukprot:s443_g47.t1
MSTLADLVLNAVEPDLDDAALATELARLRARTAAAAEAAAVASRPSRPASARPVERPASARPQQLGLEGRSVSAVSDGNFAFFGGGLLADAILARADEVEDSIDKELEEMDRQLKLQTGGIPLLDTHISDFLSCFGSERLVAIFPWVAMLSARYVYPDSLQAKAHRAKLIKSFLDRHGFEDVNTPRMLNESHRVQMKPVQEFRRQQRRDSEVETQEEKDTQEIAPELSLAASSSFEPAAPPEEVQELQRLKDLAAQMDEAFPEAEPLDGDASAPAPAPVSHFKTVLDQLDLRLRALQSKQDLHMEDTDTAGNSRSPPQMVAQLQMQNQVLRDMLSGDQRKGRLNFDRKLFGAASTA